MIFRKGKLKESIDNLIPMSSGRSYRVQVETNANLYQRYVNQCSQFNVPSLTFGFFRKKTKAKSTSSFKHQSHSNCTIFETESITKTGIRWKHNYGDSRFFTIKWRYNDIYILFVRKNKRTTLLLWFNLGWKCSSWIFFKIEKKNTDLDRWRS